jgi:hypothetical protein
MGSLTHFQQKLLTQFALAEKRRAKNIVINAGEMCRRAHGYRDSKELLRRCCEAMKEEVKTGDIILSDLDGSKDASLLIRYQLPRSCSVTRMEQG